MKQSGIDGDCMEFTHRSREAKKKYLAECAALRRRARWQRVRNWFFSPRGALIYFATGYGLLALFFVWWRS